jgi:hypothetical protein
MGAGFWETISPLLPATRHDGTFTKPAAVPAIRIFTDNSKYHTGFDDLYFYTG